MGRDKAKPRREKKKPKKEKNKKKKEKDGVEAWTSEVLGLCLNRYGTQRELRLSLSRQRQMGIRDGAGTV